MENSRAHQRILEIYVENLINAHSLKDTKDVVNPVLDT